MYQIKKTKTAAESAKHSASEATEAIRHLNALLEFSSLSKAVDEILAAIRDDRYEGLPTLVGTARKSMIAAKETHKRLSEEQETRILKAINFLNNFESTFDKSSLQNKATSKQKIIKGMIEISNIATEILSNPGPKDHANGS
jgi:hypothetical protein